MTDAAGAGGRREQTKSANRGAILAAAREVFSELGYDAAGVRDIVRATDLATGTFYNYFADKEEVFRAVVDEIAHEARTRVADARARATSREAFVTDAYRAYFAFVAENPGTILMIHRNAAIARVLYGGDPLLGAGSEDLVRDLRAAVRSGLLPELDADYMAGAMVAAALELGLRLLQRDPPDVEGATRFASELFLAALGREA